MHLGEPGPTSTTKPRLRRGRAALLGGLVVVAMVTTGWLVLAGRSKDPAAGTSPSVGDRAASSTATWSTIRVRVMNGSSTALHLRAFRMVLLGRYGTPGAPVRPEVLAASSLLQPGDAASLRFVLLATAGRHRPAISLTPAPRYTAALFVGVGPAR